MAPLLTLGLSMLYAETGFGHALGLTDSSIEVAQSGVRVLTTLPLAELEELLDGTGTPSGVPPGPASRETTRRSADQNPARWWPLLKDAWTIEVGDERCVLIPQGGTALEGLDAVQFEWRANCDTRRSPLKIHYGLAGRFARGHLNITRLYFGAPPLLYQLSARSPDVALPLAVMLERANAEMPVGFAPGDPNKTLASAAATDLSALLVPFETLLSGAARDASTSPIIGPKALSAEAAVSPAEAGASASSDTRQSRQAQQSSNRQADAQATQQRLAPAEAVSTARAFIPLGWRHIIEGYDHLAFILGMAALAEGPGTLLLWVSLFTIAHSLTLGLAALGLIVLPPALTESLIAVSVAALGMEALLRRPNAAVRGDGGFGKPRRDTRRSMQSATVFGFGLVHGLGLSYALSAMADTAGSALLVRVLWFNVGVELGQLLVVLVAMPGLWWAWRRPAYRGALNWVVGLGLTAFGSYWLFERLFAMRA